MTPHETFLAVLQHVLGQTFQAANYQLEDVPMHNLRGLFRFRKAPFGALEFQHLYHPDIARFRVSLVREDEQPTLPHLLWHYFKVELLPSDDYWWAYRQPQDLAQGLLQAGQLLFAYGVPWLERHEGV